ncbi:uncharacterized protein Fot_48487 [Forsythia ovata]|uniref:Uncharacterized protein n=1 Tax=Forsythia ovata TaxID=205694 RepID=A0ABD1QDF7_9LAMI
MQLKWLIELNEKHHTLLCVTLVKREQPMNRHDTWDEAWDVAKDEIYRNGDDFWNTAELARDDDVVFSETNATQRPPEIVQDNEEKFPFTNDDLIASVLRGHQAGPSSRSSLEWTILLGPPEAPSIASYDHPRSIPPATPILNHKDTVKLTIFP